MTESNYNVDLQLTLSIVTQIGDFSVLSRVADDNAQP